MIKAQYSAAEAQVRIGEAATGIGREMENTGLAIQRAKDKTEEMQARASAMDELVTSGDLEELGSTTTQLDRELAQLASQSRSTDELEKIKAEVGSGCAKKELGLSLGRNNRFFCISCWQIARRLEQERARRRRHHRQATTRKR